MIEIYIENLSNKSNTFQEIRYLNYLIICTDTFSKFFAKLGLSGKQMSKYSKELSECLTSENTILIPRAESLKETLELKFFERLKMSKPKKLLADAKLLEKYFFVFKVRDANLTDLDICFSKLYSSTFDSTNKDQVIILSNPASSRLHQYRDLVYGLDSKKYIYSENLKFSNYMQKALTNLCEKNKHLKKLLFQYSIGTTAISSKAFGI